MTGGPLRHGPNAPDKRSRRDSAGGPGDCRLQALGGAPSRRVMTRRSVLAASLMGLAGCLTESEPSSPTESPTQASTPTQAQGLGTIEYTVVNEDDETYRLEIAMENAEGRVVQETIEPAFEPGERVESGSAGDPPDMGPYTLTFAIESASATHVWDVRECARVHLQVTITSQGGITVERDLCQN